MRIIHNAEESLWRPFLPLIAKRSGEPVDSYADEIKRGLTQAHVIMTGDAPTGLIGTRLEEDGAGRRRCSIVWGAGRNGPDSFPMVAQIEDWARLEGCAGMKAMARLGWKKFFEPMGYRAKHIEMVKDF